MRFLSARRPACLLVQAREDPDAFAAFYDAYAERVLVFFRFSGRGKTSGLDIGQMRTEGAVLFHLRGGRVTKAVVYWDRKCALTDLGLAPETRSPGL